MKKSVFTFTLIALLGAAFAACSSPTTAQYSAEEEAVYLERYDAFFNAGGNGLNAYDTLAPLIGASPIVELPTADRGTVPQSAIDQAIAYAGERNSSALIIWHKGAVISETYFGDFDRDALVISRSLAKPLSTVAVGRALQKGLIETIDQPAANYFSEWKGDDRSKIQIRHLMDMRTGLLPQGFAQGPESILNRAYMHPRHDEVILNDYPLVDEPGKRYEYANANSELIAPLIKRATGLAYEDWISQEVLTPLGARGGEVWLNREGGTAHSGCCALLPAETYLRLAILYLQDGVWNGERLLPEGFSQDVKTPTPQNPWTGMGAYVAGPFTDGRGAMNPESEFGKTFHSEPYLADDLFLFDGNGHQVAYIIPSADLIIVRTGSRPDEGLEWDNAKLPNLFLSNMSFEPGKRPAPQAHAITDERMSIDAPDGRPIPLRVLTPELCNDCPLMIFSHGAFSTYDRYEQLLVPLAEAGYKVVAPNHVDSEEHPNREDYGQNDAMGKRVEDYAAIAAHFDAEQTIAIGHSFGGLIAQLAGGAELSGPAAALKIAEEYRPDAVVAISPPGPMPGVMEAEGWAKIEVPQLIVTGTTDILPGFVDDWRDRLVSYEASLIPETYALIYDDMDHYFDGAYGREEAAASNEKLARDDAVSHLLFAVDQFSDAALASQLSPLNWEKLNTPAVTATQKGNPK